MYLIWNGITSRNAKRAQDAADTSMYTFDTLSAGVNESPEQITEIATAPQPNTEEAIGVNYLFRQTGSSFPTDINTAVDEGFDDNVVEVIAQEAAGAPPVEDAKVRIKQNYLSKWIRCRT